MRQPLYCSAAQLVNEIRRVGSLIQIKPTTAHALTKGGLFFSSLPILAFTGTPFPGPTSVVGQTRNSRRNNGDAEVTPACPLLWKLSAWILQFKGNKPC